MSAVCKTRYEVQKILADNIKAGLTAYAGQNHGFGVMEFAQASFQSANKIILIRPIRVSRVGWQGRRYEIVQNALKRTEDWCEEQSWQISVILKKSESPSITDMQADDIADVLITWFNGVGSEEFRKYGCAPLRVSSDSITVYMDDSELYQKRAAFTLKLQVPKELSMAQDDMTCDEYTFEGTYPV